jgi:hypothetical protein
VNYGPFAMQPGAQPWLRTPTPPWHMWGNTQLIDVPIETTGAARQGVTNTLCRISYKRPESWHWLFQARLISGPNNSPTFFSRVFVHWEINAGIGRSVQRMMFENNGQPFAIPAFDQYTFRWADPAPFPIGAYIWSSHTLSPSKLFDAAGPNTLTHPVTEIVAQDLTLQVQVVGLTVADNVAAVGQTVRLEVSAQFAPKTHVRPDWLHPNGPLEEQFPGDEIGGR